MSTEMITALSAIIGAFVGAISALGITWITKIYDDKKHRREVIIRTALENWKTQSELTKSMAQHSGASVKIYPIDDFIIHHIIMADALLAEEISSDWVEKSFRKSKEIRKALNELRDREKQEEMLQTNKNCET
jgi:hypothetical protein